jgi:preprotein translocase subunit SecA
MKMHTVTLIRSLGRIAQAGAGAFAQSQLAQQTAGGKKKRRKKKNADDCTPCAAYAMVDEAKERAREGRL